ncbi:ghrelin-like [Phyllobates terribilis]|uniref:ghrelin-like n=1 Tax=Phyllobates terribilis TaxID=111132 RepID=UPI003CCB6502
MASPYIPSLCRFSRRCISRPRRFPPHLVPRETLHIPLTFPINMLRTWGCEDFPVRLLISSGKSESGRMLGKASLCAVVMFCLLWTEDVDGGSSFLSPADMQKNAGKKIPKKLHYNNNGRREAGDSGEDVTDDHAEDQEEIGVMIPLDINMKMTREQIWRQKGAIENLLLGLFTFGSPEGPQEE